MKDLKKQLEELREEHGFCEKKMCSAEENEIYRQILKKGETLPEGVFKYVENQNIEDLTFYVRAETELTKEEKEELISYKKLGTLTTIKNCLVFFTVLTVLSLIAGLIALL